MYIVVFEGFCLIFIVLEVIFIILLKDLIRFNIYGVFFFVNYLVKDLRMNKIWFIIGSLRCGEIWIVIYIRCRGIF